jgi:YidC/Oxa1 family membrane protein insertase
MEQARLILALVLSFLVFYIWNVLFVDKDAVRKQEQQIRSSQTTKEAPKPAETAAPAPIPQPQAQLSQPDRIPKQITVRSPFYTVGISEKGAVFTRFSLNQYKETTEPDSPPKELIAKSIGETLISGFAANTLPGMAQAVYSADLSSETLDVRKPEKLSFSWISPEGVGIEKTFEFSPDSYMIRMTVSVKNGSAKPIRDSLTIALKDIAPTESNYGFEGPSALLNNSLEQIKTKSIKDKNLHTGKLRWIALESRYFMEAILPEKEEEAGMNLSLSPDSKSIESRYVYPEMTIQPGASQNIRANLFFGPKSLSVLKTINNSLDKAINFGMFDVLAKPCLWLMNYLYGFIPNYGVAIIILTIMVKGILWPLGTKSYKSMNDMKKLQPEMAKIREKYKDDKTKMNQETMNLYKVYKINPMGGCLPIVVQIPVFFALYRMLYEAIELRHAPFFGWINDLSAPDRLFHFGFSIPFMQPPYGIPVLTLIMGATMLIQQLMSPPPGDPAQAKMMMFMPIIFTVIFINFSSGLVLYWLVNNILSISQQYYISKKYA